MPYQLNLDEDVATAVRRCAAEQLQEALSLLERAGDDPVRAVHGARKNLKKTRSLLRLLRPLLDSGSYRRESGELRAAGQALSGTRDADVMHQTLQALATRHVGRLPAGHFERLRESLVAGLPADPAGTAVAEVIAALSAAAARVPGWPLEDRRWSDVRDGLSRSYSRGHATFAAARRQPTVENLHDWRKRVKDLWYQQRLLMALWPEVLGAQAEQAHVLSEMLGDDHDLAVLAEHIVGLTPVTGQLPAEASGALELIEHERAALLAEATLLGRRVYAERPGAFARRLGRYGRAAPASSAGVVTW